MMLFDTLGTNEKTKKFEKAQQFRANRIEKIDKEEVWSPMSEGPYCVLHWLPISEEALFSIDDLDPMEFSKFVQMQGHRTGKVNLNGIRFYSGEKDEILETVIMPVAGQHVRHFWNAQVFHSGALEIALALTFTDSAGVKRIPQGYIVRELREVMSGFKECMSHFNITAPIIVGVSLLRVSDCGFYIGNRVGFHGLDPRPDGKQIILPGALMENLDNMEEIEQQVFDMMWRSFGIQKCPYYNEDGTRKDIK